MSNLIHKILKAAYEQAFYVAIRCREQSYCGFVLELDDETVSLREDLADEPDRCTIRISAITVIDTDVKYRRAPGGGVAA